MVSHLWLCLGSLKMVHMCGFCGTPTETPLGRSRREKTGEVLNLRNNVGGYPDRYREFVWVGTTDQRKGSPGSVSEFGLSTESVLKE